MGFGAPWMLLGLAAIAVPVLVHLVERSRQSGRVFPSLMFLRRMEIRRARRKTLRDRGLLLLRCLALAALTLAFAGPYLPARDSGVDAVQGGVDRVYLLDSSHSMRAGAWRQALLSLRDEIAVMGPRDRAAIVAFDDEPRVAAKLSDDAAALLAALESLEPGHGGSDPGAALASARSILGESDAPEREVVLVSDMAFYDAGRPPVLPSDLSLRVAPVRGERPAAVVVTDAVLSPSRRDGRRWLNARLTGTGPESPAAARVQVTVDGESIGEREVTLTPGEETRLSAEVVVGRDHAALISVEARLDESGESSSFRLVAAKTEPLDVLVIGPPGAAGTGYYVARALSVAGDPPINVTRREPGAVTDDDLRTARVAVVTGVDPSAGGLAGRLAGYLDRGGGLMLFAGGATDAWPPALAARLPGALDPQIRRDDGAARGIVLGGGHDLGQGLIRIIGRDAMDAEVTLWRVVATENEDAVLARFADGSPAMLEGGDGRGRVIVVATDLDPAWSSLALDPVFVPMMIETVRYLADRPDAAPYFRAGATVDLRRHLHARLQAAGAAARLDSRELVLESPDGERTVFDTSRRVSILPEPGFYTVRELAVGGAQAPLAVNVDPLELAAPPVDEAVFLASVMRPEPSAAVRDAERSESTERREIWWWFLAAALALFAAEAILAARTPRMPRGAPGAPPREAGAN